MMYPTLDQVNSASKYQLGIWYRFLPSPGANYIDQPYPKFQDIVKCESLIMDAIYNRFEKLGGWTPELSKAIGW